MSLGNEVAFSTDGSGAISVWEPKGGTLLMSYKGASVLNPNAMCLLGNDYVLGVEKGKWNMLYVSMLPLPLLHCCDPKFC